MLGQKTINALLTLKRSGQKSFEHLVRDLLFELTGEPYYLSSSGWQAGIDGIEKSRAIGFEAKRYGETDLNVRSLLGEIDQAVRDRPDLQLWILASTADLTAQERKQLEDSAADHGLALLTLAEGDLSVPFHPMAGLCAVLPERVCEILADPAWHDPKKDAVLSLDEIRAELEEIAASPEFALFRARLEKDLRELPTWRIFVQRQNQRLKRTILEDSKVRLGTHFDRDEVIPRTIKSELDRWLAAAMSSREPHLGAVLGERFDGKTWMLLDWLVDRLDSLDVPVFFVGSNRGDTLDQLNQMLVKEVEEALGSYGRHARALLERRRRWVAGGTPWCLLILDGLNEYRSPSHPWQRHLSDAFARVEAEYRPAAVLCTVRTKTWTEVDEEVSRVLKGQVQTLVVRPFDEVEFGEALRRAGTAREEIAGVPQSAQEHLRRPRFFQLVLKHRDRLGNFEAITEDVLYWLDASDKLRRERASAGWTEERYQGVLREFARRWKEHHPLTREDVLDSLQAEIRSESEDALRNLSSEGVLGRKRSKYDVHPDHLRTGIALDLLYLLDDPSANQQELRERLRDALSPHGEDDEGVAWLRRASVFALLSEDPPRDDVIDVLVDEWLRSRNRPPDDFEQLRALGRLLLEPLLRLAPRSWARSTGHRGLQELSILAFAEHLETKRELIQEYVRRWARLIPARGSHHVEGQPGVEDQVRLALQEEGLRKLRLRQEGDSGLLVLHGTALYLESIAPSLLEPDDLLSIVAAHHIPRGSPLEAGTWILRRALGEVAREWFERWVQLALHGQNPQLRRVVCRLLDIVQRSDLQDFMSLVELQPSEDSRRSAGHVRYEEVYKCVFGEGENPSFFLRMARHLVVNPDLPPPREERLAGCRRDWLETFADVGLRIDNSGTAEDHLFDDTMPAVAAWMPGDGAAVVRRQMEDLPRRFRNGEHWWAHTMRRHAVLADGESREHLQMAVRVIVSGIEAKMAQADILQVLLPGMQPSSCIDAILTHQLDCEWDGLYYLAACLDTEGLVQAALAALESKTTARDRARLYTLLGSLGASPCAEEQIRILQQDLESADHDLAFGALLAAANGRLEVVPENLMQVVRRTQRTIVSRRYLHPQYDLAEFSGEILESKIVGARTDLELFNIALVGRLQGQEQLLASIDILFRNRDAETRARATRLLGWLCGCESRLHSLVQSDESIWVRRIAEQALQIRRNEGFARHWLGRFLSAGLTREERWGAAQIFLEVADGCCETWAHDSVAEGAPDFRFRGEAVLLLREAQAQFDQFGSDALRKTFLGFQVWDLECRCHPWRRKPSWQEVKQRF